jgi:hypothetical protein
MIHFLDVTDPVHAMAYEDRIVFAGVLEFDRSIGGVEQIADAMRVLVELGSWRIDIVAVSALAAFGQNDAPVDAREFLDTYATGQACNALEGHVALLDLIGIHDGCFQVSWAGAQVLVMSFFARQLLACWTVRQSLLTASTCHCLTLGLSIRR